jgi:GNAT superfamily N-acetyltransferase
MHTKMSNAMRRKWVDPVFRTKVTRASRAAWQGGDLRLRQAATTRALWSNAEYRDKVRAATAAAAACAQYRSRVAQAVRHRYADPHARAITAAAAKRAYANADLRAKVGNAVKRAYTDADRKALADGTASLRTRVARAQRALWADSARRAAASLRAKQRAALPGAKALARQKSQALWSDAAFRSRALARCADPDHRRRISTGVIKSWHAARRTKMAAYMRAQWINPTFRAKFDFLKMSARNKATWADPERRRRLAAMLKEKWASSHYREKMALARLKQPKVSAIQNALYSILDDLGVKYYREYPDRPADPECRIGPFIVDCVIPRQGAKWLVIECQGDYWHSLPAVELRDRQKATYITSLPKYELKTLWEHEFNSDGRVAEQVKYWLGLTRSEAIDFEFNDVVIKHAASRDYRLLLSKYHYLANAGRGGTAFGAYLDDTLIAACVFSPLARQNLQDTLPCGAMETRELSRLCIHPRYQKRNFASWFVARCVRLLPREIKCIISYCDKTFNHDGAVYKALNFNQDRIVKPDYWYVNADGWKMHKQTLYGHARRLKMTESQFATQHGYVKVKGGEKLRFTLMRSPTRAF